MNPEDNLRLPDICPGHSQLTADMAASQAKLDKDIALIQQDQKQNNKMTEEILRIVKGGNGNSGLVTQSELNKTAISRVWYWITGISGAIIVMAGFAIRGIIVK